MHTQPACIHSRWTPAKHLEDNTHVFVMLCMQCTVGCCMCNVTRRRWQHLLQPGTRSYCAAIVSQVLGESLHQARVVSHF